MLLDDRIVDANDRRPVERHVAPELLKCPQQVRGGAVVIHVLAINVRDDAHNGVEGQEGAV